MSNVDLKYNLAFFLGFWGRGRGWDFCDILWALLPLNGTLGLKFKIRSVQASAISSSFQDSHTANFRE